MRELPFDGDRGDVAAILHANARWAASSDAPKLLITGNPGAVLTGDALEAVRAWPEQREVTVTGARFLPGAGRGVRDHLLGLTGSRFVASVARLHRASPSFRSLWHEQLHRPGCRACWPPVTTSGSLLVLDAL
ncbi:hypothetical protein ACFTZM_34875, partial [Streptomyces hydrogenans]|uniref:hypothetical protein n=1 Tax=Streptomyces hydrogenans TaxID=1873719 RepID=UPI003642E64D